jgi:hypothetical protein
VIVPLGFAIVPTRPVTEINFAYQSFVAQKAQRVVHGCKANAWHFPTGRIENLSRSRMMISGLHHLEDHPPLTS